MDSKNSNHNNEKKAVEENRILMWCSCCGQKYRLRQNLAGKVATCDGCYNNFVIPEESQTKPDLKKTISFSCKHCKQKLLKPEELAGTEISCHKCNEKNIVPEALEEDSPIDLLEPFLVAETTRTDLTIATPIEEKTEPDGKILFWCNYCGQKYRLPRRMDGKSGVCSKCKNFLFIPHVSQSKPLLKKTINFPCEHCGKKQLKAQELAGTETTCYNCSKKYIIPAKSKKTLIQIVNPINLLEPFLVAETTRTDLPVLDDKILFWCSHCGQKYRLPRNLDGKAGICTKCQSYLFIPHVSQTKPKLERTVLFPCKYCGQKLRKARKLAGTEVKCNKCNKKVVIPEKSKISLLAPAGSTPEERILFWCSYCAQKYCLPKHLIGRRGTCDKCQKHFVIPPISQTKPELIKTIIFPCADCGKTLWEDEDLIGIEVQCSRCGEGNIVPEKSEKTLIRKSESNKLSELPVAPKSMPGDPIQIGLSAEEKARAKTELKATIKNQRSSSTKDLSKNKAISVAEIEADTPKSQSIPSRKTQMVITDNLPTIHKIKRYFHEKAEKYFIFAVFVTFIDYIIDKHEASYRPSKSSVVLCSFVFAAIILFGTWNFVMAEQPDKTINSRYNITCRKCGYSEICRFKDISKQTCSKCTSHVGFTYKCKKCNKLFACDETERKKAAKGDNNKSIKCPFCRSTNTHYVISNPKKK